MSNHGNGNPMRLSKVRRQQVRNQRAIDHARIVRAMHRSAVLDETTVCPDCQSGLTACDDHARELRSLMEA